MQLEIIFKRILLINLAIEILSILFLYFFDERIISDEFVYINEDTIPLFLFNLDNYLIVSIPLIIIGLISLILNLISYYLMYKFKKSGKKMFVYSFTALLIVLSLTYGGFSTGLSDIFGGIGWALSGIILAFLYFTPIKDKFN